MENYSKSLEMKLKTTHRECFTHFNKITTTIAGNPMVRLLHSYLAGSGISCYYPLVSNTVTNIQIKKKRERERSPTLNPINS